MKQQKMYEPEDKMISLIRDNYNLLQSLGSFGISLGFGDKTVSQVCEEQHVDTYTFLAVVNFTINGYRDFDDASSIVDAYAVAVSKRQAMPTTYDFQLPFIRKELAEALDDNDNLGTSHNETL